MASGVMQIKYSEERIASKASRASNELSGISNKLLGVSRKISGMPERSRSGDNLSRASAFLKKKTQQYDSRERALDTLKERNNTFMSNVETTEKRLSSQIKKEYKEFHKQTGIGKSRAACFLEELIKVGKVAFRFMTYLIPGFGTVRLLKDLWQVGKKIVEVITEWYNNLPEGVKFALKAIGAVAVAVVAVIACVATFGAIAAAGSAIAAVFAVCSTVGSAIIAADKIVGAAKSVAASFAYFTGNKAQARNLDSMSAAEAFNATFGVPVGVYNGIVGFGNVLAFIGGIGSFTVKAIDCIGKVAAGNSFRTVIGNQFLDKIGVKPFNDLKTYVHDNGWKALFTNPIKLTDTAQMGAFKGIKSVFEWCSLTTAGKLDSVIGVSASVPSVINAVKGGLEFFFGGKLDLFWPTQPTQTA